MPKCSACGQEMRKKLPPLSNMGYRMYGRGLDDYECDNPRCKRFGK